MSKRLFITATGTDVGKTYVTALLIKALREAGLNCGYHKAAASGANCISESDAGYVNRIACIGQAEDLLLSYLYKTPVSPHLAARIEGNPFCLDQFMADYKKVCTLYEYVITEGSGGIVCPIRWDDTAHVLLEDIVHLISAPSLVVADAGLGAINATVLTIEYLKQKQIPISGIILNHYTGDKMQLDNITMIERLTGISVVATVKKDETSLDITIDRLTALFSKEATSCD